MSDFGEGSAVWYAEKNLARAETQIAALQKQVEFLTKWVQRDCPYSKEEIMEIVIREQEK